MKSRKNAGFTLLEVLVALALLGISVAAVFELISVNLRGIRTSENRVAAILKSESAIRDILSRDDLQEGQTTGVTSDGYRIVASVSPVLDDRTDSLEVKLYEVVLTVEWDEDGRRKEYTLRTLKTGKKTL